MSRFHMLLPKIIVLLIAPTWLVTNVGKAGLSTLAYNSQIRAFVSGHYTGTIAIREPASIGVFNACVTFEQSEQSISGTITSDELFYDSGEIALLGHEVIGESGETTILVVSAPFQATLGGKEITRQITLSDLTLDGINVEGTYMEVITGITADPLTLRGLILLTRPPELTPEPNLTPSPTLNPDPEFTSEC